jgi:uncharacterized repeat protein (TIGR02543 family)
MKKTTQNFTLTAIITAVLVFMFTGCAEFFHGEPEMYEVIFYSLTGDSYGTTKRIEAGLELGSLPTAPSRPGYTFAGWYTESGGNGTEYTSSTIIKKDVNLYASWRSNGSGNGNGNGNGNNESSTKPPAPTDVWAVSVPEGIMVSWEPPAYGGEIVGYTVYWSDRVNGTYATLVELAGNSYFDYDVEPGEYYYYKVSAWNNAGEESERSSAVGCLADWSY